MVHLPLAPPMATTAPADPIRPITTPDPNTIAIILQATTSTPITTSAPINTPPTTAGHVPITITVATIFQERDNTNSEKDVLNEGTIRKKYK